MSSPPDTRETQDAEPEQDLELDDGPQQEQSSARLHQTAIALVAIAVIAAALVAAFATKKTPKLQPGKPVPGEEKTFSMLNKVPQHGFVLGHATAPVTLTEYASLHCSTCAEFANDALPELVSKYVDPGQLKIVFRPLDSGSTDSLRAARVAAALAKQDLLWQFVGLVYHNQESASNEFVTENYIGALIEAIPESNLADALTARETSAVNSEIARFAAAASRKGLTPGPSFLIARSGHASHRFKPSTVLDSGVFESEIEQVLDKG